MGHTHTDVLFEAHLIRVERGNRAIAREHVTDAIEAFVVRSQRSLFEDRAPKAAYRHG